MPEMTPFLWFDDQLEEAIAFYSRVFGDVTVTEEQRYTGAGPAPEGSLMTATFSIGGNRFIGLNGGPGHDHTDAISFFVQCADQEEADRYWEGLLDGGTPSMCGWIADRFGVTWQIVPGGLLELLTGPTPEAARRATEAMFQMQRLDLETIRRANAGE